MIREKISLKNIIVLMVGIVVSLSCGAMWVSGSFNLDCFYDVGEVYAVQYYTRNSSYAMVGMAFSEEKKQVEITENMAVSNIILEGAMRPWQTMVLELGNMNQESMEWWFSFFDKEGNLAYAFQEQVKPGENIIPLRGRKVARIKITIRNNGGSTFFIDKMQLLESTEVVHTEEYLSSVLVFFLLYFLIFKIVQKIYVRYSRGRKIDFYKVVSKLQDIFIKVGDMIPNMTRYPEKYRIWGRRALLLGMLYYMLVINNKDTYYRALYFPRHVVVWALFLFGITALCKEKKLKKLNWKNSYMAIWTVFWIMICISDFVVKKRFCGWGWLMLLGVGFLFFVWGNMEKPERFLLDIIRSVEYFSVINLVFCLIARPKIVWYAYTGIAWNPNIYPQYLVPMCTVFFAEILNWVENDKKGKGWLFHLIMIISAYYTGWLSQSRTCLIALALLFLIFVGTLLFCMGKKEKQKKCWAVIISFTILLVPISSVCSWCVNTIPQNLGTQVVFPRDDCQELVAPHPSMPDVSPFVMYVKAAGLKETLQNSSAVRRFLTIKEIERFTSGRSLYWNAYLRNMNLWGHEFQLEIWGIKRGEHSAFITIPYRYGVFTIIPYVLYIAFTICYSWRYLKNHKNFYRFYPIGIAVGMLIILLVENVERPFYSVVCLAFYLLPGIFPTINEDSIEEKVVR